MKKLLFAFLFLSFAGGIIRSFEDTAFQNSTPDTPQALLAQAEDARYQNNIEQAKKLLTKALNNNPTAEERAIAERRLATLDWRFFQQYSSASEHLARAEALKARRTETLIEKARMQVALEKYDEAYLTAKRAILESKEKKTRDLAIIALATVVRSEILKIRLDNSETINFKEKDRLKEVYRLLLPIVASEPGQLEPSKLLFTISLLLNNGQNTLMAWSSYYHFQEDPSENSILSSAFKNLKDVLINWKKTKKPRQDYEKLVTSLADSRMFDEAVLVAHALRAKYKGNSSNSPRVNDIVEYALFCQQIEKITNEYYRRIALTKADPAEFQKQLMEEAGRLWERLSWQEKMPEFKLEIFKEEMSKRFGAEINLGMTAGNLDLHMGHRVIDEERTVSQYDRTAKIRFISIDSMISNGFQSWLWDGRAAHGGWATATTITQVRPAYVGDGLRAWQLLNDPVERKKLDNEIANDSIADEAKARVNPYAFLLGLQKKLLLEGRERLLTRLRSKGLTGSELRIAYLAEYDKAIAESSIFAHEGRHAIDAVLKLDLTNDEKEFRAKLSQIVFAPEPRLNLSSIFDANIGDNTPHGIANLKIMKGIVDWIEENKSSIRGLDTSKPLLPQFDLLTDEQIRALFRSMDPFSNGLGLSFVKSDRLGEICLGQATNRHIVEDASSARKYII